TSVVRGIHADIYHSAARGLRWHIQAPQGEIYSKFAVIIGEYECHPVHDLVLGHTLEGGLASSLPVAGIQIYDYFGLIAQTAGPRLVDSSNGIVGTINRLLGYVFGVYGRTGGKCSGLITVLFLLIRLISWRELEFTVAGMEGDGQFQTVSWKASVQTRLGLSRK
ncbi:hypothetical protein HYDPIDRAFT_117642, partial [Hydnomerulius pinastri MD-312]